MSDRAFRLAALLILCCAFVTTAALVNLTPANAAPPFDGVYAPGVNEITNLADSATATLHAWCRVGNVVHVTGSLTVDPINPNQRCRARVYLPVSSDLEFAQGPNGGGGSTHLINGPVLPVQVQPDWIMNAAYVDFTANANAAVQWVYYTFSYTVQ